MLQFPFQWYSTPALLKAWQDAVLTRMFYMTYEHEGRALRGKPLLIAVTTGSVPESYGPGGQNMFTMDALLAPLRATSHRCGLRWTKPLVVYQADKLEPPQLHAAAADYADTLRAGEQRLLPPQNGLRRGKHS
ncbi:NAD(P)H-dependent oxidoreductase [Sinorhizobium meliloti]|uniref:NAD(P)H-dependent oxidoreductase n=1 Tax=Rhizobium meliloti TaxID=382 RepID=UPI00209167B7|nr:NAD(P)H-dependent oxidoreductase [Sinorhizobium meliloti]